MGKLVVKIKKTIKKHLPFTLKALIIIPLIVLIAPRLIIGTIKYFQPKTIYIGKVKIEAPEGVRLSSAWSKDKNFQEPYYPALLKNTYNYSFPKNEMLSFYFQSIGYGSEVKVLDIYINSEYEEEKDVTKENFKKWMEYIKNNPDDNLIRREDIESKECFGYREEGLHYSATIFRRKTKTQISIFSDNYIAISNALHQFCPGIKQ